MSEQPIGNRLLTAGLCRQPDLFNHNTATNVSCGVMPEQNVAALHSVTRVDFAFMRVTVVTFTARGAPPATVHTKVQHIVEVIFLEWFNEAIFKHS